MMDAVLYIATWLFLMLLIHVFGRSRFLGIISGLYFIVVGVWLLSNPAVITAGTSITYTYDTNNVLISETHTPILITAPVIWEGVTNLSLSVITGMFLISAGIYMLFYNALTYRA